MTTEKKPVSRRRFIKYVGAGAAIVVVGGVLYWVSTGGPAGITRAGKETVVIAWNHEIETLDPHKRSRNIVKQSPYNCIYDPFLQQDRNLKYVPGVIEKWEWAPDRSYLDLTVRQGVKFHNGDEVFAEDIKFSIERIKTQGFAYAGVWGFVKSLELLSERRLRLIMARYDPTVIDWMGFLAPFVLPKNEFEKQGEERFFQNPIGSGPYKFRSFKAGQLELEAFEDYWMGTPAIKNVIFKVVLDSKSRAAEIEAGSSDFTLEVSVADFERLSTLKGIKGMKQLTTDVAVLFVAPYYKEFADEGVRTALHYAIDKEAIVRDVLLGFGRAVSTTEAPGYEAYPEDFTFPYDPGKAKQLLEKAGYSKDNPLRIRAMVTKGAFTRDFEVMQAVVAMWKEVGIEADIETITLPQFFDFRNSGKLAHVAFYVWSNATADPINSLGFSTWPNSPFSAWGVNARNNPDFKDYTGLLDEATNVIAPVFTEKDEQKRIEAAKEAAKWVVQHGVMIPLYQTAQPLLMKEDLEYQPWSQGWILPYYMRWKTT